MSQKNTYKKPFYKNILKTQKKLTNSSKVFNFKKRKWSRFNFFEKKKLKFFKRYKFRDQQKLYFSRFMGRGNSFKKQFKSYLIKLKILKVLYGLNKKSKAKNLILKKNNRRSLLPFLEQKLDIVLLKAKFSYTLKQAKQLILHKHILINGKPSNRNANMILKHGDILSVAKNKKSRNIIINNILKSSFWPIPPKNLKINYKTLTIVNLTNKDTIENYFVPFNLNFDLINNYIKYK